MSIATVTITSTDALPSPTRIGRRTLAALMLCAGLAACDLNEGPMEKAGESVDEAATDAGNSIEDQCEKAKDSLGMQDTRC